MAFFRSLCHRCIAWRSFCTHEGVRKDEMAFLFRRSILADSVSSLSKVEI
ncbi:hypothetical protein IG631_09777 [Alternaria alternata]|nr:hypothetical protein IG631_09777 [Alternaria alternata]